MLVNADQPEFKIGITKDPLRRSRELPERINLDVSYQIECTRLPAKKIEKALHVVFDRYRVTKQPGDGYMEWFHLKCLDRVLNFLKEHEEDFGITLGQQGMAQDCLLLSSPDLLPERKTGAHSLPRGCYSPGVTEQYVRKNEAAMLVSSTLREALAVLRNIWKPVLEKSRHVGKHQIGSVPNYWLDLPGDFAVKDRSDLLNKLPLVTLFWLGVDDVQGPHHIFLDCDALPRDGCPVTRIRVVLPDPFYRVRKHGAFHQGGWWLYSKKWEQEYQVLFEECWKALGMKPPQ